MADEKAQEPQAPKSTKQAPKPHPWDQFKVADESVGGLTIYNFREAE